MRPFRPILPYLVAAVVIAGASIALVVTTASSGDGAGGAAPAATRAAPELSPTGRLAYWRQNPAGAFILWAASFDGSNPRPLVTLPPNSSRPFGTRWTGDGRAVGFVTDLGLSVIGIDGARTDLQLPAQIRNAGYRVIDQRWSPSGTKVAATVFRSTDAKADVYFGSLERRELVRAGDLGTAFAAEWISEDEVLVESTTGVLAAVRENGTVRKLFDQRAASPFVEGGRVYFLAGPVTGGSDAGGIFVTSPAVWSVPVAGGEARREDRLGVGGDLRLDGRWPDGRYLVHTRSDATQFLSGNGLVAFKSPTVLRRVVVGADGRSAIGFGGARLVRIDLTRGLTPAENAFAVLLDAIVGADVWVRRGGSG